MARGVKNNKKKKSKGSKKNEGSTSSSIMEAKVWQPGVDEMGEDEELQFDSSAYNSLLAFQAGWPSLSFDILRDSHGLVRVEFPHTVYAVAGTQAEKPSLNSIGIIKVSNISGKRREVLKSTTNDSDMDGDSDSESDSDSEVDNNEANNNGSGSPIFQMHKVAHQGCINRIRSMPQSPHICATWGDTGFVQVWDLSARLNFSAKSDTSTSHQAPMSVFRHKDEGFAIDWSPVVPGRLVSGDCQNAIHLWEPASGLKWNVDKNPFVGHSGSVEDLQWSPTNAHEFASASVDKTIAIWDTRSGKSPASSFKAHDADVNVISWNRLEPKVLASGSDDGSFSIHDLHMLKAGGDPKYAHFTYHKHPITSIEWSPHSDSTLAVTSADNQLTIWDLSVERDEEEEAEIRAKTQDIVNAPKDLPPQLLFIHQGQKDLKEVHWHPQIPGMLISTAADGFNILIPSNIC